jgi:hypothetical protein
MGALLAVALPFCVALLRNTTWAAA